MSKFKVGDQVRHKSTGNVYLIVAEPDQNKLLESTGGPFYVYKTPISKTKWHRDAENMEERFELARGRDDFR